MSRVLITGGAGYIGSHAVYAFLEAGAEIVVLDSLVTGVRENLPTDLPFIQGDVGDPEAVDKVLKEWKPDGVLHFAGSIVVPESIENPEKYYKNNTFNSLSLFESCLTRGVRNVVFSSTAAVYGIPEGGQADEAMPTRPINPYGWSKLMTEQVLADFAHAHGLVYAALRYFNVAGADPQGRTGQSTRQATHLIKVASQVATGQRDSMDIFGTDYPTPDGTCVRDFIHVSDLAEAHLKAFEHIRRTGKSVILNCGTGRGASVRDVIDAIEAETGHALSVREGCRRAGDPPQLVARADRIRALLGWAPRHEDLREIVRSALAWERKWVEQKKYQDRRHA